MACKHFFLHSLCTFFLSSFLYSFTVELLLIYFFCVIGNLAYARYTKQYVEARLAVALGGRVAEELVYGEMGTTVGASNDLKEVTKMARKMVTEWGFSPKIGTKTVSKPQRGGIPSAGRKWGPATTEIVHEEVSCIAEH